MEDIKALSVRIRAFIDKYAGISPNYIVAEDPEDKQGEKYTSPDAYALLMVARQIENNLPITFSNSSWGSGGYKPYKSKEGYDEHEAIICLIIKHL